MSNALFTTNPVSLDTLLKNAESGKLALPDFQRSWVWDEQRIIDLLASVSKSFPIGAIMTLKTGGIKFHPRNIEGAEDGTEEPDSLILDGQQRITSLFQVGRRNKVVCTTKANKNKIIQRWFYVDIRKAIDPSIDRTEAIFTIPENKIHKSYPDRETPLDLSTEELEFEELMFPINRIFDWDNWSPRLFSYLTRTESNDAWDKIYNPFKKSFIDSFTNYQVPEISLGKDVKKEAVCTVFEKVNTGGKALDAFELVTAMYAAEEYKLRDDWLGNKKEGKTGYKKELANVLKIEDNKDTILSGVESTDFLQVISLFHTRDMHEKAKIEGKKDKDLPQITGKRQALLNLPLSAYKKYKDKSFEGFQKAAKFIYTLNIFSIKNIPYQTQLIPLAVILADIGDLSENEAVQEKLKQWYWCGVFGELYSSSIDYRISGDFMDMTKWIKGGDEIPKTITDANFHRDRLDSMRTRLSAAYKGIHVLLMHQGAKDFISGQKCKDTLFFDESVDIHHIFPQKWCKENKKEKKEYDSIINKTPLSSKTNGILGGKAPSEYLNKIEFDTKPRIDSATLNESLESHLINPELLRENNYESFLETRKAALAKLIGDAMGKPIIEIETEDQDEGEEIDA